MDKFGLPQPNRASAGQVLLTRYFYIIAHPMEDPHDQLRREIACARRVVNGVTDTRSRRVLRDYIAELENRLGERTVESRAA